eukprot:63133-Chlamydomonas_euryale.AAC.1
MQAAQGMTWGGPLALSHRRRSTPGGPAPAGRYMAAGCAAAPASPPARRPSPPVRACGGQCGSAQV